jgi:hypothetical protein
MISVSCLIRIGDDGLAFRLGAGRKIVHGGPGAKAESGFANVHSLDIRATTLVVKRSHDSPVVLSMNEESIVDPSRFFCFPLRGTTRVS